MLQRRLLLLLISIVVSVHIAAGQSQPPAVNLRQGVIAPDPGLPDVRATADRRRVLLGTQVIFTLSPASVVNDKRYVVTLYFGDGEWEVMDTAQTVHLYTQVGTYTYSLSVKLSPKNKDDDGKDKPKPNPQVTLAALPLPGQQNEPIDFVAQLSVQDPSVQYRFVYGDNSSSDWQTSPNAQHSFAQAGYYSAYVEIRDGKQYLGGSLRKRIEVTSPLKVSVTALPSPIQSGKPVNFVAIVSSPRAGTRYRFNFGDGSLGSWQDDARAQHSYKSSGRYPVSVQVSQPGNSRTFTATSDPTFVTVEKNSTVLTKPTPDSRPTPDTGPTPEASPSDSPFGSPSPDQTASADGSPSVPAGSVSASSSPDGPISNWTNWRWNLPSRNWWYLLLAVALLFLIYKATGYLFAAKPTFESFSDPGVAGLADKKGLLPIDFQLVLNPNVYAGDYSVATDAPRLITNADPLEDQEILEI